MLSPRSSAWLTAWTSTRKSLVTSTAIRHEWKSLSACSAAAQGLREVTQVFLIFHLHLGAYAPLWRSIRPDLGFIHVVRPEFALTSNEARDWFTRQVVVGGSIGLD